MPLRRIPAARDELKPPQRCRCRRQRPPSPPPVLLPFVGGPCAISNDDPIRASLSFLFPFMDCLANSRCTRTYASDSFLPCIKCGNLGGGQGVCPANVPACHQKSELPFSVLIGVSFSPSCRFGRVQSVKLLSGAGSGHDGDSATVAFMDITSACKVSLSQRASLEVGSVCLEKEFVTEPDASSVAGARH